MCRLKNSALHSRLFMSKNTHLRIRNGDNFRFRLCLKTICCWGFASQLYATELSKKPLHRSTYFLPSVIWTSPAFFPLPRIPVTTFMYRCLMGFTYVCSDYVPYQKHGLSSFNQLDRQVAPLIVIWLAYGIFPAGERGIAEGWGA